MWEYVDIYCERLAPGLLAEPLNLFTNASFFIAAYFAYALAKKEGRLNGPAKLLIFLLVLVGAGSSWFHSEAVFISSLGDSLSILFYQLAYIFLYARRVMRIGLPKAAILLIAFTAVTGLAQALPDSWLNGSLSYAPAVLFLAGFAFWHQKHAAREKHDLILATLIFLISFTFRSIDMAVCAAIPIGTHFLWHVLNGVVLYMTTRAYILNAPDAAAQ